MISVLASQRKEYKHDTSRLKDNSEAKAVAHNGLLNHNFSFKKKMFKNTRCADPTGTKHVQCKISPAPIDEMIESKLVVFFYWFFHLVW